MDLTVIAIVIFALFSIFVPASMLLTSFFFRRNTVSNTVRDAPYESSEESRGTRISVMTEYLHYFGLFIAFETLLAIILIWAPVAKQIPLYASLEVFGLLAMGVVFGALVLFIARAEEAR